MDVGCWPVIIGVASFRGWPPGVPGGHLLLFGFWSEVGDGGGRVARRRFPFVPSFASISARSFPFTFTWPGTQWMWVVIPREDKI